RNSRARRVQVIGVLAALTLSTGCAESSSDQSVSPQHPNEADQLVFALRPDGQGDRYDSHSYWIYGNRRIFMIEWRAPPSWKHFSPSGGNTTPNVNTIRTKIVSQKMMERLLGLIESSGVLNEKAPNFGKPASPDGYNNIIVHAGGVSHDITYQESAAESDMALSVKQNEIRNDMQSLTELMYDAMKNNDSTEYDPGQVALLVRKAEKQVTEQNGRVKDWPLQDLERAVRWEGSEERGDRCLVVESEQAKPIIDALDGTEGQPVAWRWDGDFYQVWPHPMLPDEKNCSTLHTYFGFPPDGAE